MLKFTGQPVITGGTVSGAVEQHNAPPVKLFAATMLKLPYTLPTNTDPQRDGMVASAAAFTVMKTFGPTNLSLGMEPTNENVAPGLTTPENTVPIWSAAVTFCGVPPLNRSVRLFNPPVHVPQLAGGGQSHD
jgi:hypothetical protein